VDEQQKQSILDLPKVIAVGISSPVATILTSRFGIAGTLIGLALSAVILTVLVDILKVYLARAPGTVAKMPGGFRARLSWRNIRGRIRAAFDNFWSLSPAPRRSILVGSVIAGVVSFFVGLSVITGLELSAGKSLSCWVWNECPAESADGDGEYSTVSTRPSIFGGGRAVSNTTSQTEPFGSEQQSTPGAPGSPSRPSDASPGSGAPGSQASEEQRSPFGGSEGEGQQWSPSDSSKDRQPEEQQWSPSSSLEEDQQPEDRQSEDQQSEGQQSEDQQSEDQQPKNRQLEDRQQSSSADSEDQQSYSYE